MAGDTMQINRISLYLIVIALLSLSDIGSVLAADQQPNVNLVELNDSTLNGTLAKYPLFILDCNGPGCQSCQKRVNSSIYELSYELMGQATFGLIYLNKNNTTAKQYNITAYPTLLIFENGMFIQKDVGSISKAGIMNILQKLKPDMNTSNVTSVGTPSAKAKTKSQAKIQKNCNEIKKQNQPLMQAFVVSYCPFGLQMQRILNGIVSKVPSLSKNIKVRYIIKIADGNMFSMHGQTESDENLRQICIREEQPDKYWNYFACFANAGNCSNCTTTTGVDKFMLDDCMANESRGFRYIMMDYNITRQLNITGSPTLVMNDEIVDEYDFGGRTEQAVKCLLCCGFSSKPDSCYMNLSTAPAKTGFASKISLQPSDRSKFSTAQIAVPLAELGVNNPGLPMPVTDETLANAIEKYPFFVLMGFADWCGYCQMMNSTILELSEELKGRVAFGLMDAEKNNETAQKFNLVSYPRLLIFRNGILISTQTGYRNTSRFSSILEELEPTLNRSLVNASTPSVAS